MGLINTTYYWIIKWLISFVSLKCCVGTWKLITDYMQPWIKYIFTCSFDDCKPNSQDVSGNSLASRFKAFSQKIILLFNICIVFPSSIISNKYNIKSLSNTLCLMFAKIMHHGVYSKSEYNLFAVVFSLTLAKFWQLCLRTYSWLSLNFIHILWINYEYKHKYLNKKERNHLIVYNLQWQWENTWH